MEGVSGKEGRRGTGGGPWVKTATKPIYIYLADIHVSTSRPRWHTHLLLPAPKLTNCPRRAGQILAHQTLPCLVTSQNITVMGTFASFRVCSPGLAVWTLADTATCFTIREDRGLTSVEQP